MIMLCCMAKGKHPDGPHLIRPTDFSQGGGRKGSHRDLLCWPEAKQASML